MNTRKLHNYIQAVLAMLCVVFILLLTLEMTWSHELDNTAAGESVNTEAMEGLDQQAVSRDAPPITAYAEIIERPLFMDDRRPYQPEEQTDPDPVSQRPTPQRSPPVQQEYALTAVIINGDSRVALIKSKRGNKTETFMEGDSLDAWTIREILRDKVTLEQGSRTSVLELKVAPSRASVSSARRPRPENDEDSAQVKETTKQTPQEKREALQQRRQRELPENREVFDRYNNPPGTSPGSDEADPEQ